MSTTPSGGSVAGAGSSSGGGATIEPPRDGASVERHRGSAAVATAIDGSMPRPSYGGALADGAARPVEVALAEGSLCAAGESFRPEVPAELPAIPGGWRVERRSLGGRTVWLARPAAPDAFLDDPEVLAANQRDDYMPYWASLWPAATVLAEAVFAASWPAGTAVLELGCGVGLVGLAGLLRGWRVTFSDYDATAAACAIANARLNGVGAAAEGLTLDWRTPLDRRWPAIIACDILYELRHHEPLLRLLDRMLSPGGVAWFADPGRAHAARFIAAARRDGWRVEIRDEQGRECPEPRCGAYQRLELSKVT